jgi:peptidyl-Lys metalloendopeptidase
MKIRIILMVLTALLFANFASAKVHSGIEVKVQSVKGNIGNDEDVFVKVSYKNRTGKAVNILKWYLPDTDGNLEEGIFKISRDGEVVDYIGRHYKRPAPTTADYISLKPNQKISYQVELSAVYDFSEEGYYQVGMSVENTAMFAVSKAGKGNQSANSLNSAMQSEQAAEVFVRKVRTQAKRCNPRKQDCGGTEPPPSGDVSFTGSCSNSEQSTLLSALDAAKTMTNSSVSYLNGNAGARYTTWFGNYSSTRWNKVASNFDSIKDAFDNKAKTLDCSCNQSYYAYVYPNQPYKIYLCRAFWNAPMTGTDSKGGTLVHEMSHFNATAGTDDIVYGQTGAKNLAISDPNGATNNADSHEYFAENKPSLN